MKNKKSDNLLKDASGVIYNRNTEKSAEYGPFDDSMASAARIASELTGKNITTEDFYKCMMALKLARLRYSHKEDTFLDLLAYSAALHKRIEDKKEVHKDINFKRSNSVESQLGKLKDIKYIKNE
jgi:hypothetical protein